MECVHCKDSMSTGTVNYPVDLESKFILIKEVPANICSQCGAYYLDDGVLIQIEDMVIHVSTANFGIEIEVVNYKQPA